MFYSELAVDVILEFAARLIAAKTSLAILEIDSDTGRLQKS